MIQNKSCFYLVYELWDLMIEKVKLIIYEHLGKLSNDISFFHSVVYRILYYRRVKSNTPLHCLTHS